MAQLIAVQTRIEPELHEKLETLSKLNERSIAAELRLAIKAYLNEPLSFRDEKPEKHS